MTAIGQLRNSGIAILLVGVVFVLVGAERRQQGGSIAFIPLGLALVVVGLRRMRRAPPDPTR